MNFENKTNIPRYRVDPIIDTKHHYLIEKPGRYGISTFDFSCYEEVRECETTTTFDYCPFCGESV